MVASNSEFPFQAGRARWNTGGNITVGKIPTSICSSPCGMGEIKNFEVEKKKLNTIKGNSDFENVNR